MDLNFTYIKKAFYYIILSFVMLRTGGTASAQVKFHTDVNTANTSLEEYIQLDYVIENAESVESFTPPSFNNFKILQGPSQSENVTIVNGAMSRSKSVTYILQPLLPGKQIIPGAMAVINGKTMRSNSVSVHVARHGQPRGNTPPPGNSFMPDLFPDAGDEVSEEYRLDPGEDANNKIIKNLLVRLEVNKKTCYVGEPFVASYKLYSRLRSESRITKRPSLDGFSVFDMDDSSSQNLRVEKIRGKSYNVHMIRRTQLLPLQAGSFVLDPMELENKVEFMRSSSPGKDRGSSTPMQRMMDEFFGRAQPGNIEEHNITLKSDPVTITVNPLPEENKPEGFKGAVGNFTINASLKRKSIAAGDAGELEVIISGSGNLPMINPPHIDLPPGMEAFDPAVKEELDKKAYPLKGFKKINYTFLARNPGDYNIPAVKFSYFDPASATYKTISSDSFAIQVTKSNKTVSKQPADTMAGIGATPLVSSGWTDIINREMIIGAAAILLLILVVIYLLKRARKKTVIPQPPIKATLPENSIQHVPPRDISLEDAGIALEQGKSQEFYNEVNKAIREAVYLKTNMAPSELTKFNMLFKLKEKGVATQTIQDIEAIMKECEIALYTPIHEETDMRNILEKTRAAIGDL